MGVFDAVVENDAMELVTRTQMNSERQFVGEKWDEKWGGHVANVQAHTDSNPVKS